MKQMKKSDFSKELSYTDFISIGLACHGLCLLEEAGILKALTSSKYYHETELSNCKNPDLVRAALITLVGSKVLSFENSVFSLTALGKELANHIGTFLLPFSGYRKLLLNQAKLLEDPNGWKDSDIDFLSIAKSSIQFGENDLDPILLDLFTSLKPKGTICDLGCGTGEKLSKICQKTQTVGLGIERDPKVIEESKKFTNIPQKIEIIEENITKLEGVWEDVEIGLISFVLHDIDNKSDSLDFLNSLPTHFPRMQCFIIVDIVTFSEQVPSIMPGFDYVHGLQGVSPRTYEETMDVFSQSIFRVRQEILIPNMPNTYIWVIEPKL